MHTQTSATSSFTILKHNAMLGYVTHTSSFTKHIRKRPQQQCLYGLRLRFLQTSRCLFPFLHSIHHKTVNGSMLRH